MVTVILTELLPTKLVRHLTLPGKYLKMSQAANGQESMLPTSVIPTHVTQTQPALICTKTTDANATSCTRATEKHARSFQMWTSAILERIVVPRTRFVPMSESTTLANAQQASRTACRFLFVRLYSTSLFYQNFANNNFEIKEDEPGFSCVSNDTCCEIIERKTDFTSFMLIYF